VISASFIVYGVLIDFRQSLYAYKKGFFRLRSRTFRFFPVDFVEHCLQLLLEGFVFGALVEFAYKVASNFEGVIGEIES